MGRAVAKSLRNFSIILFCLFVLTCYAKIDAASSLDVVINEIAWMGTEAYSVDEWIELYNTTDQDLDLTGWTLEAADGTPSITLSGTIPAHGYLLLERTDDTTVSDITADQIYTGALVNDGEELILKDTTGAIIDTANDDGGGWPAGDKDTKSTMERIDPLAPDSDANWATNDGITRNGQDANGNLINGTPKAQNSVTNFPPVADANGPYSCSVGDTINLDGSGSSDSDGSINKYEWDYDSDGQYDDATGVDPAYNCTTSGIHTIGLKVTDNDGAIDTDSTTVDVNQPPVADPDGPYFCNVGDIINLDGSGSSDADGSISEYEWDLNNDGQYDDATGVNPSYSCSTAGSHTVGLKVTDDHNATDADSTTVNVNSPPTADFTYSPTSPTTQDSIQFTDQSSDPDGTVDSWDWDFGDGNTSTTQNPTHQYGSDGTYTVTLTVTDENGATDSISKDVTVVNVSPSADANGPYSCNIGEDITLDGSGSSDSDGTITSYEWDYDDEGQYDSATGVNPTYNCTTPGTHTIGLKVTDNDGATDTDSTTVDVNSPPTADAGSDQSVALGSEVQLDGSSSSDPDGDDLSFSWSFITKPGQSEADFDDSARVDPIFVPDRNGTYRVKLTVNDGRGGEDSDELSVTVTLNPKVKAGTLDFNYFTGNNPPNFNAQAKADLEVDVGDAGAGTRGTIIVFKYDEAPDNPFTAKPPLKYLDVKTVSASAGTAHVKMHYQDSEIPQGIAESTLRLYYYQSVAGWILCANSSVNPSQNVIWGDIPVSDLAGTPLTASGNSPPTADADGPYSCSVGDTINLDGSGSSDSDGSITKYEWDLDDDGQYDEATGVNPSYNCSTANSHTVRLKVTDGDNATDTDSTTVSVNSPPEADFTYSPTNPTTQDTIQFTDQSTDSDGTIDSWDWDFGDGGSSTNQNPTHQYASDGSYTVTLTVTDQDGATDTTTKEITVGEPLSSGDCNGDGVITMEDANLAAEFALGLKTPTDAQKEAADVVAPFGVIDIRDAIAIAEVAQGVRSGF